MNWDQKETLNHISSGLAKSGAVWDEEVTLGGWLQGMRREMEIGSGCECGV